MNSVAQLPALTDAERKLMRHALGLYKTPRVNRNFYEVTPGNDYEVWRGLCDKGLAWCSPGMLSGSTCFHVTEKGMQLLLPAA